MAIPSLRKMTLADSEAVVGLNAAAVDVTSPMNAERFGLLHGICTVRLVAERHGRIVGFVLAIPEGAAYDNGNYRWFSERLRSFLYVDRIVVCQHYQGLGLGGQMYSGVLDEAAKSGALSVCAEMDLEPPNMGSLSFHLAKGFSQIGTRRLDCGKLVSMQVRGMTSDSEHA